MNFKKAGKGLFTFLIIACFGWTLYWIYVHDESYRGEPLTDLNITISKSPEYYSHVPSNTFYYYFTTRQYPTQFRISYGGNEIVRNSKDLRFKIENLAPGDSVRIAVRTSRVKDLKNGSKSIRVIGLAINNQLLIDPEKAGEIDRENQSTVYFYTLVFALLLTILYFRKKWKKKLG